MAWRNRVEVSYGTLKANVAVILAAAEGRRMIAVIKADAYGLGLERCARIYLEAGVSALAVAALSEADRVRAAVPDARVLLLGSPLPEERPAVVASGYEVCCSSIEEVQEFAQLASTRSPHPVHVMCDTGMGRFGAVGEDAERVIRIVLQSGSLRLAGICTHYPMAIDAAFSEGQERSIRELITRLPRLPEDCWIHYANSEGVLLRPAGCGNTIRVGLLISGVLPEHCPNPGIAPAVRWVSSLSLVKQLPAGHSVGYDRSCILERSSRIGIIPVGYADGYPLALSNKGSVLVQGRRCPILGRVTMDYLIVDLTDLPHPCAPGEPVVLFGSQAAETITVNELARLAGTIPYDILCGLRGRCEVVGVP
jgi:alanine racemase